MVQSLSLHKSRLRLSRQPSSYSFGLLALSSQEQSRRMRMANSSSCVDSQQRQLLGAFLPELQKGLGLQFIGQRNT
jgi:hypothetical protein